jgi:hypothetical protein
MKKIILTVAGSMLIALATVNAQEKSDTTRTKESSSEYRKSTDKESGTQSETSTIQGKSGTQGQYSWRDEDRESITREDLPSGLITTLESDEYKGWESATIYRNKTTSDYMLVMQENGEVKTLYFDKEGKAMTSGDQSGTSGQYGNETDSTSQDQSSMSQSGGNTTGTSGNMPDNSSAAMQSQGAYGTSDQWRDEDRVTISSSEIPSSLRMTLGDDQYKGWENSSIYRNRTSNDYMLELKNDNPNSTTVYYFDKEGKPKHYYGTSSYRDSHDGQKTSSYPQDQQNSSSTTGQRSKTYGDQSSTTGDQSDTQSTTSGAIGTSQVGDDNDAAGDAEQDATLNRASTQSDKGTQWQSTDQQQPSTQWRTEDRVMVTSSEIPASLRVTLADDQYKGWENSTIYRNRTTNDYMIEIRDGSDSKVYYFDKDGKAKTSGTSSDTSDDGKSEQQRAAQESNDGAYPASATGTSGDYNWTDESRIIITAEEVPSSLRTTLSDSRYKGWETSTIYRNRETNEYLVEIKDGGQTKMYYFDKNGKAKEVEMNDDKD